MIIRLVGAQNALYMLSTAKVFNAQQLVDIGFCVPEIIEDIEDWATNHLSSIDRDVFNTFIYENNSFKSIFCPKLVM